MSVVYTLKSVGVLSGTKSWLPLHWLFCNCSEIWFSNQQNGSIVLSESGRRGRNPNLLVLEMCRAHRDTSRPQRGFLRQLMEQRQTYLGISWSSENPVAKEEEVL